MTVPSALPLPLPVGRSAGPGRFRRVLGVLGTTMGLTLVFASALVVSVAAHLDLGPTRRTVRIIANGLLGTMFKGSIVIGPIDRLSLRGLSVQSATALDPYGNEVAKIEGLRADTSVITIVRSALFGGGKIRVPIPLIHIDHVDVELGAGPGGPLIAETFILRKSSPRVPNAIPPQVTLDRIEIDRVTAHGALAPRAVIDAALTGVLASVRVDERGVAVELSPLQLAGQARPALPEAIQGKVSFKLQVPPAVNEGTPEGPLRMEAGFDGSVGAIEVHAGASIEGPAAHLFESGHARARIELPEVTAQAIAAFLPDPSQKLPLHKPLRVLVTAEGDLPELAVAARIDCKGCGDVDARGKLSLGAPLGLDLDIDVHQLDPRLALELPEATPLDAKGHVHLGLSGGLTLDASVTTKPLSLANNRIPAVDARASLSLGKWKGTAHVEEEGAPTDASFTYSDADGVGFEVDSRAASLRAVRRIGAPVDGSVKVKVAGTFKDGAIDARVTGRVDAIRAPGDVQVKDGTIQGRVRGPVSAPTIEASFSGRGARAGRYSWDKIDARAAGPLGALRVETNLDAGGGESISASGALDAQGKALRAVKVAIKRTTGTIEGTVEQVSATPAGVAIDGLEMHGEGIGNLHGGLRVQGQEIVGKLHGRDVDIAKVLKMVGVPTRIAGLANIDVDLTSSRPGQRRGHVDVELVNGEAAPVSGVSGLFSATFEGERVRLDGLVRLIARAAPGEKRDERCDGAIAALRVSRGEGLLGGPLLDPATWARASGKIEVAAEDWNLRCLSRLVPVDLGISEVRGKLTTYAELERRPGARLPSVRKLRAVTRGLEVAGPIAFGAEKAAWESRSVDVELRGSFDPMSGVTSARLTLGDGEPIATFGGRATLDVGALLDHPERRADLLLKAPLDLKLSVPRRAVGSFGTLPSFVRERLPPVAGEVELTGSVTGSVERPRVDIRAGGWDLALVTPEPVDDQRGKPGKPGAEVAKATYVENPWGLPLDVDVVVGYDGDKATLAAHVKHDQKAVMDATADLAVAMVDLLAGRPIKPRGSLEAKVQRLPLGDLPFCADRGIEGHLVGDVAVTGIGEMPALKVALAVPDLKIGHDLAYDKAEVTLDIGRPRGQAADRGAASARVELSSKAGGKLSVNAFSDIVWQGGLMVPTLDATRPADLVAKATRFRIAVLGPFLSGLLSRVDGTLDGEARLGSARLDAEDSAKMAVRMKLTGGIFHVPQLGQELHHAEIDVTGGAGGVINLDRVSAYGAKGRITGKGQVRFDGLRFARANAAFTIKPGEEMPITLEGVPFGDAYGRVEVTAEKKDRDLAITVGIPRLHVALPSSTGRSVQGLDDNPDVRIKQDHQKAREAPGKDATRMALIVNLGDISVKGSIFDFALTGVKAAPIRVEVADKARVSGDIRFTRGRVEILKKQFQIEQGLVHLRPEDPANPYVNVTARWDSPDGVPIYIEYAGVLLPIDDKKIKYHSPKIADDQIMATLLFGGAEQSTLGTSATSPGVPGTSLATSIVAQQLSTQIAGNISTNIGTNDDGSFRPGLVYNSGDKVIELSTYGATGQGATTGAAPKGQRTLITVDWRFWSNWLLRGRVDAGSDQTSTGLDVLWQYRY